MADVIDRLGIEFFSKLDPAFGTNVQKAVKDFEQQLKPILETLNKQWQGLTDNAQAYMLIAGGILN